MASAAYCLLCRLLCIHQHFHLCAGLYCRIVEITFRAIVRTLSQWKNTASERARERANTMVRAPTTANTEATKQKHNCWVRTPKPAKTETTKQKQHTTHDYSIYSSVAISVHCCLDWCSHRHLASVFAPYIYPAILHRCSHLAFFLCAFPMVVQARFWSLCVPFELK